MPIEKRLYPSWIPALGLACCVVLAASQGPLTIASGVALLVIGCGLRIALRRYPTDPLTNDGV